MYNQKRDKDSRWQDVIIKLKENNSNEFSKTWRFKDIVGDGDAERVPRIRKFSGSYVHTRTLGGEGVARLFTGMPWRR